MSGPMVRVDLDTDTELYPVMTAERVDAPRWTRHQLVPADVWARYEQARAELRAAEDALGPRATSPGGSADCHWPTTSSARSAPHSLSPSRTAPVAKNARATSCAMSTLPPPSRGSSLPARAGNR